MKLTQLFVSHSEESTEEELAEIRQFRTSKLQLYLSILDGRTSWGTLISVLKILIDSTEDKLFTVCNNGLSLIYDAFNILHLMHHEATACHVTQVWIKCANKLLKGLFHFFKSKILLARTLVNFFNHHIYSVSGTSRTSDNFHRVGTHCSLTVKIYGAEGHLVQVERHGGHDQSSSHSLQLLLLLRTQGGLSRVRFFMEGSSLQSSIC